MLASQCDAIHHSSSSIPTTRCRGSWEQSRGTAAISPLTFLALGKKGSHLSLSGRACAFSLLLATRGSRLRMPVWFMYVLRAKAMGELQEKRV